MEERTCGRSWCRRWRRGSNARWGIERIAREQGVDRKMVKRWLRPGEWQPRRSQRRARHRDRFAEFFVQHAPEIGFKGVVVYRELQALGFSGAHLQVQRFVRPIVISADGRNSRPRALRPGRRTGPSRLWSTLDLDRRAVGEATSVRFRIWPLTSPIRTRISHERRRRCSTATNVRTGGLEESRNGVVISFLPISRRSARARVEAQSDGDQAPVSRSAACYALWARCVRLSFTFAIFDVASLGSRLSSCACDPAAPGPRVGVAIPACAIPVKNS